MTIAEILKAKGVADDVVQAVLDDMKANKIFTSSEENLDIRYGKLKNDHEAVVKERDEGKALIETLQKANKGNETLQQQVTDYKAQVEKIQAELAQNKIDSAINIGLLAAGVKADDVDYVTFKLKSKGEELALDENGKIKGWDDKVAALKVQLPNQFEATGQKKVIENRLPEGSGGGEPEPKSLADALRMNYENNSN